MQHISCAAIGHYPTQNVPNNCGMGNFGSRGLESNNATDEWHTKCSNAIHIHTPNQPVERWNFQKTIQLSVRGFAHLDRWLGPTSLPQLEPANSNLPPGFCRDICVCYGQLRPPPVHQQISTWVGWAPELVEVSCLQYVQTSNPEKWCSPCGGVAYSWPILLIQCFQQAAASKIVQPCYRVCRAYVFDFFSKISTYLFWHACSFLPVLCLPPFAQLSFPVYEYVQYCWYVMI